MTSGLVFIVTAWCVKKKGPVYASAFNPLNLLVIAIAASLLLDETLYVGRYAYEKTVYTLLEKYNI